ncbi:hypothetical protein DFH11DRAFT_1624169 [Phellopilus nigrolimitatus]|nr:hypothetical protein DFH11DRAFT_1624169 [Phellopilus nigrolimitatus]
MSDLQILNVIASFALMVYDCAICFPTEKSKWTRGKLLYLGCRYPGFVLMAFWFPLQNMSVCPLSTTKGMYRLKIWFACPQMLISLTYALYCGNKAMKSASQFHAFQYNERNALYIVDILRASSGTAYVVHCAACLLSHNGHVVCHKTIASRYLISRE